MQRLAVWGQKQQRPEADHQPRRTRQPSQQPQPSQSQQVRARNKKFWGEWSEAVRVVTKKDPRSMLLARVQAIPFARDLI